MTPLTKHVFESGDKVYLVAPVTPFSPEASDIEHFAFAESLKKSAPNQNIAWFQGNYVEADNPNANGHQWTAGELVIKSLTPMFCPVTVMHDPRTAVGVIADTRLRTPEADGVPRSRIETALALWEHRFPDVVAEARHNYEHGELMQSMECTSPYYDCAICGETFHKLPDEAEREMWCEHLAESPNASRILRGVTFTGTGLIFGSRGARGAYSEANLETAVKQEIVAAHQESHQSSQTNPRRKINFMDITDEKYAELIGRPTKEEHASIVTERDEAKNEAAEATKKAEEAEIAKKKAEDERDDLKSAKEEAEEKVRQGELASGRLDKLGKDFKAKLSDTIRERLETQAKEMSEEDWEARLSELEDLTEVQRDAGGSGSEEASEAGSGDGNVTPEETASAKLHGGGNGNGAAPSKQKRSSVVGSLVGSVGGRTASKDD